MGREVKHGLIKISFYISFPTAGLYFLNFAKEISNTIISNIVAVLGIAFVLFCIVCCVFLSDELHEAQISSHNADMYKRQADYYAKLYYEEVRKNGEKQKG